MTRSGMRGLSVAAILLSAAIMHAQTTPAGAADEAAAVPAPPPAPVFPKRPAELPPKAPKVTCHGNEITISADNSTLSDILAHVKGCTGARIEIPEGATLVRSFEELGPGPVGEVLDELLSGTPYNYVIQSSEANPLKVESVLLSMRGESDGKPGAGSSGANSLGDDIELTTGRRLWKKMQKFDKPDPSMVNEDGTLIDPENATAGGQAQLQAAQPVDASASPDPANPGAPAAADLSAATPPVTPIAPPVMDPHSNGDPSTAIQDRISQMQQLFNQRQQMLQKQGQSPAPGGSPNN
jgi:hypothetical protein